MTADPSGRDAIALWQSQDIGREHMSVDEVRRRVSGMESRLQRRRLMQRVAFVMVLCGMTWTIWRLSAPLQRIGAGIVITTALVAIYRSGARGRTAAALVGLTPATCRAFLLAVLVERRNAARAVLWWQIAPFAAGMAVFLLGLYLSDPQHWQVPAGVWLLASLQTGIARWRIDRTVRRYDREIGALEGQGQWISGSSTE